MDNLEEDRAISALLLFQGCTAEQIITAVLRATAHVQPWLLKRELCRQTHEHVAWSCEASYIRERLADDCHSADRPQATTATDDEILVLMEKYLEAPDQMCEQMGYSIDELCEHLIEEGLTYVIWDGEYQAEYWSANQRWHGERAL